MLGLLIGTFISLIIDKLLNLYFISISFYYDFMFFSYKNLLYVTTLELAFGWFAYGPPVTSEFLILKTIKLAISFELFLDDFIIIFENVKFKNLYDYWQLVNKIFITHGKRFMLFKDYRNSIIINIFQILIINFSLLICILIIEICTILVFVYWLNYLLLIEISKKLNLKLTECTIYLKGLSSKFLYKSNTKYLIYNYTFLIILFVFFFKYYSIYSFFDISFFFILLYFLCLNFSIFYLKFCILYNFYFSFVAVSVFNKFLRKIRLSIKTFYIKFSSYVLILLLQISYLLYKNVFFEYSTNDNFFQEFLLKNFLIIIQFFNYLV